MYVNACDDTQTNPEDKKRVKKLPFNTGKKRINTGLR